VIYIRVVEVRPLLMVTAEPIIRALASNWSPNLPMVPRDTITALLECNGSAQLNLSKILRTLCNQYDVKAIEEVISDIRRKIGVSRETMLSLLQGTLQSPAATDSLIIITEPTEDFANMLNKVLNNYTLERLVEKGIFSVNLANDRQTLLLKPGLGYTLPKLVGKVVSVEGLPDKLVKIITRGRGRGKAVVGDTLYIRVWEVSHPDPSIVKVPDSKVFITYGDWLRGLAPVLKKLVEGYVKRIIFFDL